MYLCAGATTATTQATTTLNGVRASLGFSAVAGLPVKGSEQCKTFNHIAHVAKNEGVAAFLNKLEYN